MTALLLLLQLDSCGSGAGVGNDASAGAAIELSGVASAGVSGGIGGGGVAPVTAVDAGADPLGVPVPCLSVSSGAASEPPRLPPRCCVPSTAKDRSIASSDIPLVSGSRKNAKRKKPAVQPRKTPNVPASPIRFASSRKNWATR